MMKGVFKKKVANKVVVIQALTRKVARVEVTDNEDQRRSGEQSSDEGQNSGSNGVRDGEDHNVNSRLIGP